MMPKPAPDIIVCNVHLPRLDGYEVARRLKGDATRQHVPLVAVTALAMVGDKDKVLSAGFDGYISKPINPRWQQLPFVLTSSSSSLCGTPNRERSRILGANRFLVRPVTPQQILDAMATCLGDPGEQAIN